MNGSVAFEDIEFLSEDELLKITPKFREARLQMISGEFGPFTPGVPLKVPAWMAINLGTVISSDPSHWKCFSSAKLVHCSSTSVA